MHGEFVRDEEVDLTYGGRSFLYPRRRPRLHAMLTSCGYSREVGAYDWDGLKRGHTEFVLLQHTVGGEGRLTYEGRSQTVGVGDAMLLHFPHANRYWLPAESAEWRFIFVCLHGRVVLETWRELERTAGPVVRLAPDGGALAAARKIVRDGLAGAVPTAFQASALAYELTMALADELLPYQPDADQPAFVQRAARYCREHLAEPIGVADLARAAGYSRHHFSRRFAASQGVSPVEFIRQTRVEAASRRLQSSPDTVGAVARACGFHDASYFCRVFRQQTGMSPDEFRRSGMY